ncbi:ABC transporter substrate-binding protein [Paenibacillus sp. PAMC21692]|uniref:ABC transporter substrate-binding protein n=1 Tax=Paenibacillus sp. PAMC21692 TaxID=2762320 RepID=UPI0021C4A2E8|nr:ABC transporter substrate-binding protein [Paenibacillus sp. PAMC21692]
MQRSRGKRRGLGVLFMLTAVLLLLAACGSENSGNGNEAATQAPTASAQPEPTAIAEALPETKKVTDDLGREVEVPVQPSAIVAGEFASELLALGIKPVGSGDNGFKIVYTQAEMEGVERIGDPPNPETVTLLAPDLVIAPTVFLEIYPEQMEQIGKIAPIFYISFEQDPIYDIFAKIAELVGKTEEAKKWIQEYEAEASAARDKLQSSIGDETVTIFRVEKGRLRIYLNRNFGGYMLRSGLQAKAPEAVAAEIEGNIFASAKEISLELLPEYAGDHIFLIVREEGDDKSAFEEIEKSGLWSNLDAVKNGNVHRLETDKYYGSDIVTIRETMKEALGMLAP